MNLLKRRWVPLVVVLALAIGGFAVYRLHGIFPITSSSRLDPRSMTPPYAAKSATYEIVGPPGTVGVVNWMDEKAQPRQESFTTLPWSRTITARLPGIFAYVVAQGNSGYIGCRITVDGRLVDQQSAHARNAQISCLDKSA
ncbi:MmpS family transport accessory protein [Mycobacterium sp. pUA109]|uniref:MmpS family transport accessory protein n=1 Tax=Mycobacterium sp. pUA109 TaxID=3238982 RepID=UPI00351AD1B7